MSNNQLQANPQLVIKYLTEENTRLNQENAMLKAIIEEISQEQSDSEATQEVSE